MSSLWSALTANPVDPAQVVVGPDRALTQSVNWQGMSHQQLYDAINKDIDPGRGYTVADGWQRLGSDMNTQSTALAQQLAGTEAGWQGAAADEARQALGQLAAWGQQAANTSSALSAQLHTQTAIVDQARAAMPPPPSVTTPQYAGGGLAGLTASSADAQAIAAQEPQAHDQAVQIMTAMESQSKQVDGSVPAFVPPPGAPTARATPRIVGPGLEIPRTGMQPAAAMPGGTPAGPSMTTPSGAQPSTTGPSTTMPSTTMPAGAMPGAGGGGSGSGGSGSGWGGAGPNGGSGSGSGGWSGSGGSHGASHGGSGGWSGGSGSGGGGGGWSGGSGGSGGSNWSAPMVPSGSPSTTAASSYVPNAATMGPQGGGGFGPSPAAAGSAAGGSEFGSFSGQLGGGAGGAGGAAAGGAGLGGLGAGGLGAKGLGTAGAASAGAGGAGGLGAGLGGARAGAGAGVGAGSAAGAGGGVVNGVLGQGARSGVGQAGGAAAGAAAAQGGGAPAGQPGQNGAGAGAMGGARGGRREEDKERKSRAYVRPDKDVFTVEGADDLPPSVIGALPPKKPKK